MSTKHMGQGGFSPYDNPYDAFNNYMNVLSDFIIRVNAEFPESIENEELNALLSTIKNQGEEIELREDDDDDDVIYTSGDNEEVVVGDTNEVLDSGFVIDEDGPEDIMDVVFSDLDNDDADPETSDD